MAASRVVSSWHWPWPGLKTCRTWALALKIVLRRPHRARKTDRTLETLVFWHATVTENDYEQ